MPYRVFFALALILCSVIPVCALEPTEVAVIANSNSETSVELAKYYMKCRKIPAGNLLAIPLRLGEQCSRSVYDQKIADPLLKFLLHADLPVRIKCLVLMPDIPLRVKPQELSKLERAEVEKETGIADRKRTRLNEGRQNGSLNKEELKVLKEEIREVDARIRKMKKLDQLASVDSELSMVRVKDYRLEGWLPNPHFIGYDREDMRKFRSSVLMVSRLDGPDARTIRRMVDDAIHAENQGLSGSAYFDARFAQLGKDPDVYKRYDQHIRKASEILQKSGFMKKVILDTQSRLFQKGQCPDAALYCGWYSLAKYVDAFEWNRGAVGFHIASAECVSLKDTAGSYWCPSLLKDGICATLGPVAEPYLQAFPVPDLFFKYLVVERRTLVESYFMSLPFVSWRMVLIGDPLYRPFKNRREPFAAKQDG